MSTSRPLREALLILGPINPNSQFVLHLTHEQNNLKVKIVVFACSLAVDFPQLRRWPTQNDDVTHSVMGLSIGCSRNLHGQRIYVLVSGIYPASPSPQNKHGVKITCKTPKIVGTTLDCQSGGSSGDSSIVVESRC